MRCVVSARIPALRTFRHIRSLAAAAEARVATSIPALLGEATPPAGSFRDVGVGLERSCAVREGGAIECWGYGGDSEGSGAVALAMQSQVLCWIDSTGGVQCGDYSAPERVLSLSLVAALSPRFAFRACAVGVSGDLHCWTPTTGDPEADTFVGPFVQASVGSDAVCAVRPDDTIGCWGDNPALTTLPAGI